MLQFVVRGLDQIILPQIAVVMGTKTKKLFGKRCDGRSAVWQQNNHVSQPAANSSGPNEFFHAAPTEAGGRSASWFPPGRRTLRGR
jgi:hypothetical protein